MKLIVACGYVLVVIVQVEAASWLSEGNNDTVSLVNELDNIELNVTRRTLPTKKPVSPMVNLARGRPTWQSSTLGQYNSHLAVDGKKNKALSGGSCTHTMFNGDKNPWWAVDLGKVTDVYGVELTTISDCCYAFRMDNFIVGLTNNPPSSMSPRVHGYWTCGQYPGKAPEGGQSLVVPCVADSRPARYVVILAHEHMNICELEVYEAAVCPNGFIYLSAVNGCYKPVLSNLEWPIAALSCRSLHKDAHLVFINNANEQNHVKNLLLTTAHHAGCNKKYGLMDGWWTGGHQTALFTRTFVWRSAEGVNNEDVMMTYAKWFPGEPNSFSDGGPMCICAFRDRHFDTWNDCPCTDTFCSLCEIDL